MSFSNGNRLEDRQVKVRGSRADDVVPLLVAKLADARLHIASLVLNHSAIDWLGGRFPLQTWFAALRMVSPRIGKIGGGDIERKAALHGKDAASLPSANQRVGKPIRGTEKLFALSERKLIHPAELEHLPGIEVRLPILRLHIRPILRILEHHCSTRPSTSTRRSLRAARGRS